MAQSIEDGLLEAVQKDDIKAFNALTEKARCGAYRLGRFPVLSLLYLYKSRRILSVYEEQFLKISDYETLREPVSVSKRFAAKAGKCLRLYLNEVVSPLEMLLILDKTRRLKRVYPAAKPSKEVKARLKSIYYIKYSLSVKFEGDGIVLDRRPLSRREKKGIATACLCLFLAVTIAIGTPLTVNALIPKRAEGEVTKLEHIDFGSQSVYTLKKDITLPENFSVEKVNCKIYGGGKKLTFGKGASLGELNGLLKDLQIDSGGSPLFTQISEKGTLQNATVNVTADAEESSDAAFVALTNYGTISGVTVNISGKFSAVSESENELYFGGIVYNNSIKTNTVYGTVDNCTVNYDGFTITGETKANASFGGVAGVNGGYIKNCLVTGAITSDTVDLAGVCGVNNGILQYNANQADIAQTSDSAEWSPITSGIALNNTYIIEYCENTGDLSAVSKYLSDDNAPSASVSGIAYMNSASITYCINRGDISASCGGTGYAGGIAARTCEVVYGCYSSGAVTIEAKSAFAGGIFASGEVTSDGFTVYCGAAESCISENKIIVSAKETSCTGGIAGFVQEGGVKQYKRDEEGKILKDENGNPLTETIYFGGGVTDSFFIGERGAPVTYFGNIVGVCGANIYESNSYTSGNKEYHNFEGNYYANNSLTALGATVADGEFVTAEDKGATAAAIEDIKNLEAYKLILSKLEK